MSVTPLPRGRNPFDESVPAPGAAVDVEAVIAHTRERLADFKVLQYVVLRSEPLPHNPGGKLLKGQIREQTEWGAPLR